MLSLKTDYHPIEVAIEWCNLTEHATEILRVAFFNPDKLQGLFPQWPYLHAYTERIYDAIVCGELPAWYLGRLLRPDTNVNRAYYTVRRSDLRRWVERDHPDDKPKFLFSPIDEHTQCVSLGAHLAQKSELDVALRELLKLRQLHAVRTAELESQVSKLQTSLDRQGMSDKPSEDSTLIYCQIIGSLLAVTVGKSPDGQVQSIYKNQASVITEITRRFPAIRGLSKTTLDRKFAEAWRCLEQEE
ncbi:hypothetical protein LZ023_20960 [Pseudomonas silvicola]|nr:hypothetical protein LZ023_20960 [Pseudomonas silvicola]